jgi:hypothetical protein
MAFLKIDTSKLNKRYGRGGPVEKAARVSTFNTPNKNRAPDIPKTEAKEGDVLSYFDDTKGKVLTSFDGGYQSSETSKVSDMNKFEQGQFVTTVDAPPNAKVQTRGEIQYAMARRSIISLGTGSLDVNSQKYMDYLTDDTCDTTNGSSTITCDSTNILNGKIKIGMNVVGTGIPEHAIVKVFLSTTSFAIGTYKGANAGVSATSCSSVNATADGTNVELEFYGTTLYLDGSRGGKIGSIVYIDRGNEWYKNTVDSIIVPRSGTGTSINTEYARGEGYNITLLFGSDGSALRAGSSVGTGETYSNNNNSNSSGQKKEIAFNNGVAVYHSSYEFIDAHIKWLDIYPAQYHFVELESEVYGNLRISSVSIAPNQITGNIKHVINMAQHIRYADSSDNTVITEVKNTKIPAKAIISKVVAKIARTSNLTTHAINLQMSATSGTAADSSISSGTELLGAGVANTDSTDSASASDIDLKQSGDVWICKDTVRNGGSDQYLYICNAGTGNGTTNSTAGTVEIYIEYYV